MKVKINQNALLNLVSRTQNIVEKKNTMPVLVNVLFETQANSLKIFATDLEVSLIDEIEAEVIEPGKAAVNAKILFEFVRELGEGPITLTKKSNNWLEIKQNKSLSNIVGISPDEYPIFPSYSGDQFVKIPSDVLSDMIEKTIYSVSNDETRYHLNGVFFESLQVGNEIQYKMVATDGFRLSIVTRKNDSAVNTQFGQGIIIPRKGLNEIRKLIDSIGGVFEMAVEGSQLVIKNNTTLLMVRLIEGKYPNYQQLIPQNLNSQVLVNRGELLTAIKRVSLLSNQKSKGITLAISQGKVEISSNNPELGDAKEEIEVKYRGNEIKIGMNAKFVLDVLNSFDDEEVDLHLNDQLSPGLIRPHNDASYTCVIMPMRI